MSDPHMDHVRREGMISCVCVCVCVTNTVTNSCAQSFSPLLFWLPKYHEQKGMFGEWNINQLRDSGKNMT